MSHSPLTSDINAFQDSFIPTIPEATLNTLMSELQGLMASGIKEKALSQNATFPAFELANSNNKSHSLADFLKKGPW